MDAVFFDMDGVLIDSVRHKRDNWHRLIVDELDLDADVDALTGLDAADKYAHLQEHTNINLDQSAFVNRLTAGDGEVYAEHAALLPGFSDLAGDLRSGDVHVGIVSASGRDDVETIIDRFGLDDTLDVVVSADDVDAPNKPDPAQYLHAVSRIGVDSERALAVEDSRNGAMAVVRAGMYCIGYAPAHHPGNQDLSVADEVATDPLDLRTRVRNAINHD